MKKKEEGWQAIPAIITFISTRSLGQKQSTALQPS
jgi:hypothetical protein